MGAPQSLNQFSSYLKEQNRGILRRRKKYYPHWETHLERCKEVQADWVKDHPEMKEVQILGAGHLLDVNPEILFSENRKVVLVDADRQCSKSWNRYIQKYPHLQPRQLEVTGVIERWLFLVKEALAGNVKISKEKRFGLVLELLSTALPEPDLKGLLLQTMTPSKTGILSLNLLSQIPIVWRETILMLLKRDLGSTFVEKNEARLLEVLSHSCQMLVKSHLKQLAHTEAASFLVITDVEFVNYQGVSRYFKNKKEEVPFTWQMPENFSSTSSAWSVNSELSSQPGWKLWRSKLPRMCEVYPALYGVNVEDQKLLTQLCSGYRVEKIVHWLWHIAPLGLEKRSDGWIHRVVAVQFRKDPQQSLQIHP